ncbi:phospholipase A2 inhibitor and Ly6/PLAUR domain-containing protein-like [Pyxicephalus adspersus]|uniref:phospholipase A2 inhibitor and Ly6/PLAUR domain-containing protein-like n=1 Tax=Pyxicephalus adspersus TaxID=30357 RepID=UPI003B5A0923
MRNFVGTLIVTITCIVSVYSLKCMHCESSKDLTCTGEFKDCSHSDETCSTYYYVERKGKDNVATWVIKGCKKNQECTKGPAYLSNPNVTVALGVACCTTNSCAIPENLFPATKTPNNLTCTSCFSTSVLQCETKVEVKCNDNENICGRLLIDSVGSVDERWSMRGCATKEFCSHQIYTPGSFNLQLLEKECTDSSSIHKLSIVIFIVALLRTMLF